MAYVSRWPREDSPGRLLPALTAKRTFSDRILILVRIANSRSSAARLASILRARILIRSVSPEKTLSYLEGDKFALGRALSMAGSGG